MRTLLPWEHRCMGCLYPFPLEEIEHVDLGAEVVEMCGECAEIQAKQEEYDEAAWEQRREAGEV